MTPRRSALRPGVTMVELMVALALFSVVLVTTLTFYQQQSTAFTHGNRRMTVMQNLRYGVNTIEQQLRTAGVGVPAKQPVLVYLDDDALAFNADYATNIDNDFFATYYDPRLPNAAVSALTPDRSITLPHSAETYPDSAYYVGSANSPAETILFFFDPDTTTTRTDDYTLFRQVNDQEPEPVARRLLRTDREFFTYYVLISTNAGSPITEVPNSYLPGFHSVAIHGTPADTGIVAGVDSVRAVRVTYAATNGLSGAEESVREITRLIRLPNAGLATQPNCGNKPLLGSAVFATGVPPSGNINGHVLLEWARATDEYTGEQDVLRYVIWRTTGGSAWGDPLASVPAGLSSYSYRDFSAAEGVTYRYAIAAQDCTPQYSPMAASGDAAWVTP